jgi:hypothetical protein
MLPIQDTCQPRADILQGSFNPEIFTASLSQVMDHYRGKPVATHALYTNAEAFFRDATYPTEGLRMVLADVFSRLAGDHGAPALHRLETAFGGGKTHALIALTHLGFRGRELAGLTQELIDPQRLHAPGEVAVVGIAGDEIPVHRPQGTELSPYTLWGELAYQVGGESLYRQVESDATAPDAPARGFFERVLGGRKVIIMLDELAQYAARLEAARPHGSEQLAAFLLALHGYARAHAGIAVVLTLASQTDAFARQTGRLVELLATVRGEEVSEDAALGLAQQAVHGIRSVVARDAVTVVPVQAAEISRVLARRLFDRIDRQAARDTANAYMDMYSKSAAALPERARREDFREALQAHYPFHPTFIDFLTQKLATIETFQGTRGVLRVLSLAVRSLWGRQQVPMLHTCHLDLRDARTVNEILGRTGGGDLLPVLNTDVGGADTARLAAGQSRAQSADQKNPHPAGYPLFEYTWKTVFLHSLVGRAEGLGSNLFGITEREALLEVAFPGMTPPQVQTALGEIEHSAYFLRCRQGRYYASLEPSIPRALAGLRNDLRQEAVWNLLDATARKVVDRRTANFQVEHDVSAPEHVPDGTNKPLLALIALGTDEIEVEKFITTCGPNRPRLQQNLVFLLVPETVHVKGELWNEDRVVHAQEVRNRLEDLARDVLARRQLKERPENHGITAAMLREQNFDATLAEREQALVTAVSQTYDRVWFPSAAGRLVDREVKTAGGEGGASVIERIRETLSEGGELITAERATTQETVLGLVRLFFESQQTPTLTYLREQFACQRRWPVLEEATLLESIVRAGVAQGHWCLFRMGSAERTQPEHCFSRDSGALPLDLDLSLPDWSLVTTQGARQRGWLGSTTVDTATVERWVASAIAEGEAAYVSDVMRRVQEQHGEVPQPTLLEAVRHVVQARRAMTFSGRPDQPERPTDLVSGSTVILQQLRPEDVVITPAAASTRGWVSAQSQHFHLSGRDGAAALLPLLRQLGSLYARGARSTIAHLDLVDLQLPGGGRLRLSLEQAPPAAMQRLGELFEVLATVITPGPDSEADLDIADPDEQCLLIQALRRAAQQGRS